jgi:uncharacterized protein (DUF4415 family)
MGPFYEQACKQVNMKIDAALLDQFKAKNKARLDEIDKQIEDAEKNLG